MSQLLTCTNPNSLAINAETILRYVARMSDGSGAYSRTVEVNSVEDYNTLNNKANVIALLHGAPVPAIVISKTELDPGEQATVSLNISEVFFHDLDDSMNTLTMTFVPSLTGASADPAVQFATGGQQVPFVVRANTLAAEFHGVPGPLGFQAGTLAGTITFKMTFRSKTGKVTTRTATVNVAKRKPVLQNVTRETTSSGFVAAISLASSTREVGSIKFQFNGPNIRMSCGNVPGCVATSSSITFFLSAAFSEWYAAHPEFGTAAVLRVPFSFDGKITGTVVVTITNSLGATSTSFPIP